MHSRAKIFGCTFTAKKLTSHHLLSPPTYSKSNLGGLPLKKLTLPSHFGLGWWRRVIKFAHPKSAGRGQVLSPLSIFRMQNHIFCSKRVVRVPPPSYSAEDFKFSVFFVDVHVCVRALPATLIWLSYPFNSSTPATCTCSPSLLSCSQPVSFAALLCQVSPSSPVPLPVE